MLVVEAAASCAYADERLPSVAAKPNAMQAILFRNVIIVVIND